MKFKRKVLLVSLAFAAMTANAAAEQPAAEEYRQMFRSGNFYVEYQTVEYSSDGDKDYHVPSVRASRNGDRVSRRIDAGTDDIVPKNPDVLFQDGMYYRFQDPLFIREQRMAGHFGIPFFNIKKKDVRALVLPVSKMDSPSLNPNEGWDDIKNNLSLPEDFCVFFDDPYRTRYFSQAGPRYNGSSKRMMEPIIPEKTLTDMKKQERNENKDVLGVLFGKKIGVLFSGKKGNKKKKTSTVDMREYDCDQYVTDITNLDGTVIAQYVYNMLYDNGKLVMIQKYLVCDGFEDLLRQTTIRQITADVPPEAFKIRETTKLYGAGLGDMNDLLENHVQVGTIGGDSNAK